MHPRERVIRDRFSGLACAHCGSLYAPAAIVVLARRSTKWMVLACCYTCDRQAIFVVTFPRSPSRPHPEPEPLEPEPLSSALSFSADTPPQDFTPSSPDTDQASDAVSTHDVDAMHEFLARFDGDFQSLFTRRTRRPISDEPSS